MILKNLFFTLLFFIPFSFAHAEQTSAAHDAHYLDVFSDHHRQGIEMAKLASQRAQDPELKKFATKMVEDQTKELKQMEKWKETFFPQIQSEEEPPKKMDMSKLQGAKGAEFDRQFTKMMLKHHQDGVKMTETMAPVLQNKELKAFAKNSISKQNEEMKKLNQFTKSEKKS